MNALKLLSIAILTALLSACGPGSEPSVASAKAPSPGANGARGGGTPRKVNTLIATEKSFDQTVSVTGTLAAENEVVLGMKVAGRIADLRVDLGSTVRKGDVIARLDPTDFQLRVRQSEAALQQALFRLGLASDSSVVEVDPESLAIVRQAKAELTGARARADRAEQLDDKGLIAKADLDVAQSAYRVAEAKYEDAKDEARNRQGLLAQRRFELELARQQLADTMLYSPIDGMISVRQSSVGQYAPIGATVVTVVQMNPLRLRAAVPERQARDIRIGQPVRVTVDGVPGQHDGHVERISPAVDETNRTLLVEAAVSNPRNLLRPGAFVKSEIIVSTGKKSLVVPANALAAFAGVDRVFIVKDGKAQEKRVKTGRVFDQEVEILEGISSGDLVVVEPGDLNDGDRVGGTS
jgi:RND family efflux transporter MFP subunit